MEKREGSSSLEAHWDWLARAHGLPPAESEYPFARHLGRRFRFDRAWPEARVAVELEGGVWSRGRHVRGEGFERDCEKYNLAQALGWKVFRFTGRMLKQDPKACVGLIRGALDAHYVK